MLIWTALGSCVAFGVSLWLWYRWAARRLAMDLARQWQDLRDAQDAQQRDHAQLIDRHHDERARWHLTCTNLQEELARQAQAGEAARAEWASERSGHLARTDALGQRATTARHQRQAAVGLLRKVLRQRTLARGMPVEDTAEAFAFLVRTPDDELPQVHEQVLDNQTLRRLHR